MDFREIDKNFGRILYSPMPDQEDFEDGAAVTPWTLCLSCIQGYEDREKDMRPFAETGESLARLARGGASNQMYSIDGAKGTHTVVAGLDAIRERSAAMATEIAAFEAGKEDNAAANDAYTSFYEAEVEPVLLSTQLGKAGCRGDLRGYPDLNFKGYWEDYIDDVSDYMDCRTRTARSYDFEGYARAYPGLKAEADALHAQTFGIEKRPIPSPEGQLASFERDLDRAQDGLEVAYDAIGQIAEDRRQAEETRRYRNRMLGEGIASFGTAMKDVANNAPIVTADGTLTTYGKQQAPIEQAKRLREMELAEIEREAARKANARSRMRSRASSSAGDNAPVGDQKLYLAANHANITDCSAGGPYNILEPGEPPVECSIVRKKDIFVLGLARDCETLENAMAEGNSYKAITILRVDGLTRRAAQALRDLAAKDLNEPFAAENSLTAAISQSEDEWSRKKTHDAGVPLYYPTLALMDASARTLGCNGVKL